jgi:1,4-alpha-glucan branching enzyme
MRKNNSRINNGSVTRLQRVHFEFRSPAAASVFIAGAFNDWQPQVTPMIALGEGHWAKDLVLPVGDHEYRLIVDGQWIPDPQATAAAPNPFGGVNSVRKVGG